MIVDVIKLTVSQNPCDCETLLESIYNLKILKFSLHHRTVLGLILEMCFSIVKKHFRENQSIQAAFQHLKQFHFQSFFQKSCTAISKF